MVHEIHSIPSVVPVSAKKSFILNMNNYRNAHFRVLAKAKVAFNAHMDAAYRNALPPPIPFPPPYAFEYFIMPNSHRDFDLTNVGAVVDKFVSDWLVASGLLPDDGIEFIAMVAFRRSASLTNLRIYPYGV
jgi:hypothetical protein